MGTENKNANEKLSLIDIRAGIVDEIQAMLEKMKTTRSSLLNEDDMQRRAHTLHVFANTYAQLTLGDHNHANAMRVRQGR